MSDTWYVSRMARNVGATEMLDTACGNGYHHVAKGETPEGMIENVRAEFLEGIQKSMQDKREHGSHPINAFEWAVPDDAPDSVISDIAASEKCIFDSGLGERRDEVQEYLDFLEEKLNN